MIDCALWYRLCALSFVIQSGWMERWKKFKFCLRCTLQSLESWWHPRDEGKHFLREEFKVFECSQNCTNIFAYSFSSQIHFFLGFMPTFKFVCTSEARNTKKIYMQIWEKVNILTRMENFSARSRYLALSD